MQAVVAAKAAVASDDDADGAAVAVEDRVAMVPVADPARGRRQVDVWGTVSSATDAWPEAADSRIVQNGASCRDPTR